MNNDVAFKTVMVHSYKGGTGKTAIAVNLAQYLSRVKDKKVLVIEQDMAGPTFDNIFDLDLDNCWNDFLDGKPLGTLIKKSHYFDVINAKEGEIDPGSFSLAEFFRNKIQKFYSELRELTAKQGYDYYILDTRPGKTKDIFLSLPVAGTVIFITRLDSDNINKTIKLFEEVYASYKSKEFIIVENQVPQKDEASDQDSDVDRKMDQSLSEWNGFCRGKKTVTIPLSNRIAYGLYRSKIVKTGNPFMEYIEKIVELIE